MDKRHPNDQTEDPDGTPVAAAFTSDIPITATTQGDRASEQRSTHSRFRGCKKDPVDNPERLIRDSPLVARPQERIERCNQRVGKSIAAQESQDLAPALLNATLVEEGAPFV